VCRKEKNISRASTSQQPHSAAKKELEWGLGKEEGRTGSKGTRGEERRRKSSERFRVGKEERVETGAMMAGMVS
jgi:hypothetical protein